MSTSTIEMDEILAEEVQKSVQQSAQVRDPNSEYQNVLQRFSQAIDFSDPTKEIRILDLENYLNDPTKSSEVKFGPATFFQFKYETDFWLQIHFINDKVKHCLHPPLLQCTLLF